MTSAMSEEVLQGSVEREGIEIRWIMPEGFFELPMEAEDEDEIGERLVDLARRALPGADFEIQLQWAVMCAANYGAFAEAGVQYAGFCMTEVDGTRCTATVNVSLFDLDARAGSDPAGFIASSMRYLDSGQVAQIDLPAGLPSPALATGRLRWTEVSPHPSRTRLSGRPSFRSRCRCRTEPC